ncbi:LysM peptidoglycan-binding domain-containing protein [Paenibacillus alkaliterrae]|uniref:LysM peptidoglycan-binding domain-containing protein n=1 Tax=Paenibacillus alkaliterrae TaxID=320909 RepID=UPI001F2764F5|nr:LysM peptidoglycan-binding domain-containing protein [Paenibacillus alkaliterrae]MCF2937312.1 LysM peptidoglycan-binding domain-containing protein [Paenibacillus alkaliterrae]
MSDQTNGLRFDVYERVHLPDDVAAIDELEEIELVPRIQVIDQGEHAVLKGQLLLTGVYRGQNETDAPLTLEHWIPVEITLPMNRISRLDDISIEIDNFDVDLLSARTLNITGVLSLRGITAQPAEEQEEAWREEPFTVVHQRDAYEESPEEPFIRQPAYNEHPYIAEENYLAAEDERPYQQPELSDEAEASVTISSTSTDTGWSSSQLFASNAQQQEQEAITLEAAREITLASQQTSDDGWLSTSSTFTEGVQFNSEAEQERELIEAQQSEVRERSPIFTSESQQSQLQESELTPGIDQEPDKQELRIAFAGKQPEEGSSTAPGVGILTLLQTSRREQAARQAAEEVEAQELAAEEARVQASGDEIEWKNLFLGKRSEDREFRKIRMCIVQRDETLDVIASRYSLNPREILIYNRLDESAVSEGQLLYIP